MQLKAITDEMSRLKNEIYSEDGGIADIQVRSYRTSHYTSHSSLFEHFGVQFSGMLINSLFSSSFFILQKALSSLRQNPLAGYQEISPQSAANSADQPAGCPGLGGIPVSDRPTEAKVKAPASFEAEPISAGG
jgi:hypothetical protein